MSKLRLLFPLLALLSTGCSRLDGPVAGDYRAVVEVKGGQVPLELRIGSQGGTPQLWLLQDGDALAATAVQFHEGVLEAQLPEGAGNLKVSFSRKQLKGELQIADPLGKTETLPFNAELNQRFRFVAQASTDNADISGYWQLSAISPDHFSAPVTLQLRQSFDAVDGKLILDQGSKPLTLYGQANGDDVYLSALSQGRTLLFKGKVDQHGDLQGQIWINSSQAQPAIATRIKDEQPDNEEVVRKVALPWAVPTR